MTKVQQDFRITDAFSDILSEKKLDNGILEDSIREAILTALEKKFGTSENAEVDLNVPQGMLQIKILKKVVKKVEDPALEISLEEAKEVAPGFEPGDTVELEVDPTKLGRTAITEAKNKLAEKISEATRERIFQDYKHKLGDIVHGSLQRIERGNVIVNLGNAEGVIRRRDQIPGEKYQRGVNIRAYIKSIERSAIGPQIILSRRSVEFLEKLFEFEVPEIYEKRVLIKAVAREAGKRAKIAVNSMEPKIDPVGACVGLKGVRVQSVVRELNNEKIDIVRYSNDPKEFIARSLAPATIIESFVDQEKKSITVIVKDDEVSLAIGRGGQNARLAAKLTGWNITLYGQKQYKESLKDISELDSISEEDAVELKVLNINSLQKFVRTGRKTLLELTSLDEKKIISLLEEARELIKKVNSENAFVVEYDREEHDEEEISHLQDENEAGWKGNNAE